MADSMGGAFGLSIPLEVSMGTGHSWAERRTDATGPDREERSASPGCRHRHGDGLA